ncbi:GAF and ANTAR domain-containing protein [Humibacillus xanthopallidus]|uniref:GAF domain-containing protein n=1 Tax=Humibacillus xanthopallidus TaxID=412689 RepID=A0A543HHY4_9MICO|nr:GAF and ANTAR domain-containing protein [Humibacillus xanthopallidus]TQM57936.1 GAF domain-containing protein [Humibacillus xanthopallidus]
MRDRASILSELAKAVAVQERAMPLPERLCHAAVSIMGARGASLTIAYTAPHRVTLCSTDDEAARLEDLQDVLGQGPGPTAYRTGLQLRAGIGVWGEPVDARWVQFDEAVRDAFGAVRMTAIPVHPDGEILGVLTCHQPADSTPRLEQDAAQFLADAIGVSILKDPDALATDLSGPWASRAQIHQATGMVVSQLRLSPDEALALLRAHAFAHTWPLARVAAAVVTRELDFAASDRDTEPSRRSPERSGSTPNRDGTDQP